MPPWLRKRGSIPAPAMPATPITIAPPPPVSPMPSPVPPLRHAAEAVLAGVAAASDAAVVRAPIVDKDSVSSVVSAGPRARAVVHLLWFDAALVVRVRSVAAWSPLIASLEDQPLDRESEDFDQRFSTGLVEDRRAALEVLAQAPAETRSASDLLRAGVRKDGRFLPRVALFAGELVAELEEHASLRVAVAIATPFATDEETKTAIAEATPLLQLPTDALPPDIATAAIDRIRRALSRRRQLPASYLDDQIQRALTQKRAYSRRDVFGGPQLRLGLFVTSPSGKARMPLYLPASLASTLPLFSRFAARVIVEVEPRADQTEDSPVALRCIALGRELDL